MKELLGFGARSFSWPENRWQRDVSCYSVWRWWCCDTLLLPVSCHKPIPVLWTGVPIWLAFFFLKWLSVFLSFCRCDRGILKVCLMFEVQDATCPPRGGHLYAVPTVWGVGPPPAVKRACITCSWTFLSKAFFFFQRRKSLGSHVLMRNTNVKALWKSLG